jgi:hypothetical protein
MVYCGVESVRRAQAALTLWCERCTFSPGFLRRCEAIAQFANREIGVPRAEIQRRLQRRPPEDGHYKVKC